MMMAPLRGPEPGRLLVAALLARLPTGTALLEQDRTPWASATFVGTRHRLLFSCPDRPAADAFAATVAEDDFALRGHLLAGITADADADTLLVEALTLIEA
ncbi:hypothetical protein [Sphingomonas prati]|uniref:Uncharacterized protein n=1 Tax=Sphingomonas prati TaxID=1843237 RepID=A0A7W9BU21_9SPHN|nr:hypothetical protein [Sphingomonas prati]MBB5730124.1 hypothetical protein [Sphingomonas prati]